MEPWYAIDARIDLAYRIASKRPAEAVRMLENIPQTARWGARKADGVRLARRGHCSRGPLARTFLDRSKFPDPAGSLRSPR